MQVFGPGSCTASKALEGGHLQYLQHLACLSAFLPWPSLPPAASIVGFIELNSAVHFCVVLGVECGWNLVRSAFLPWPTLPPSCINCWLH